MVQYRIATTQTQEQIAFMKKMLPTPPLSNKHAEVQFQNDVCYMSDRHTLVAFEMDDQFVGYDGFLDIRNIVSPSYADYKIRSHIAQAQAQRLASTVLLESTLKGGFDTFYSTLKASLGVVKTYVTLTDDFILSKPEHLTALQFTNHQAKNKEHLFYFLENTHARRIYSILRHLNQPKEKKLRVIFCYHTHPILSFALVGVNEEKQEYIRAVVIALCEYRGAISVQPVV